MVGFVDAFLHRQLSRVDGISRERVDPGPGKTFKRLWLSTYSKWPSMHLCSLGGAAFAEGKAFSVAC